MLSFPVPGGRARTAAAALAFVAMTSMTGFGTTTFGYELSVNGAKVGTVRDMTTIEQAVADTQNILTTALGHEYIIETEINPTLSTQVMDAKELEAGIIDSLPEVTMQWTINVNGETVGVMPSKEAGEALVKEIMSRYTDEHTVSVSTLQTVTYELKYVSSDVTRDEMTIKRWLNPINENSPYRLQVLTVENEVTSHKIPHETEYIDDWDHYQGDDTVEVEGVDGRETIKSTIQKVNGNEILRTVNETSLDKSPVTERILKGRVQRPREETYSYSYSSSSSSYSNNSVSSYSGFIWPARGVLTSYFGYRNVEIGSSNHKGIDIAGDYYSSVVAAASGEVVYADWMSGYGYLVIIQHYNGMETYYAHNTALNVYVGEQVSQGETIAFMGSTGNSSGVHCHFEVRIGGEPYNPLNYLP